MGSFFLCAYTLLIVEEILRGTAPGALVCVRKRIDSLCWDDVPFSGVASCMRVGLCLKGKNKSQLNRRIVFAAAGVTWTLFRLEYVRSNHSMCKYKQITKFG